MMTQYLRQFIRDAVVTLAQTAWEEDPSLDPVETYLAIAEVAILKCVEMPPGGTMRPLVAVRFAHDAVGTLLEEDETAGRGVLEEDQRRTLRGAASVLCWALGHEGCDPFSEILAKVVAALERRGLSFAGAETGAADALGEELMKGKPE